MKKFIIKALLISIGIMVPLTAVDILMTIDYRSRNYYPFTTMNDIVEGRINSDLWVLGSSRAWVQYNPKILDSILKTDCYVLGCNSQFLFLELQYYKIARLYNPKPKTIILDIFWESLTMDDASISRYFYMPYIYNIRIRKIIKQNTNISFAYLYFPYYRYYSEKANDPWYKYNNGEEYKGFKAIPDNWDWSDLERLDTVHYHCETEAIILLNDFLQECRNDSISVILVHSPFCNIGFEIIDNNEQMMELFQNIADNNNVPFLDYTKSSICYDTLYFYNAMHLNAKGAYLFSTQLAHDLDSLGIIPSYNN